MAETERARELIREAETFGLRTAWVSGFLTVTRMDPLPIRADAATVANRHRESIEQLGRFQKDVFAQAAARTRGARGSVFVGKQVFISGRKGDPDILGKIEGCDPDGGLLVTWTMPHGRDEERSVSRRNVFDGGQVFIIVAGEERPDQASSPVSPWIFDERFPVDERLRVLIESAEKLGLRFELDGAFVLLKWSLVDGVEKGAVEAMTGQLGKFSDEIVRHLFAQGRAASGPEFVGARVFVSELDGAFGILDSCGTDGNVTATYQNKRTDSRVTSHVRGDRVLILLGDFEEGQEETDDTRPSDQKSEKTWLHNMVRRAFRRLPRRIRPDHLRAIRRWHQIGTSIFRSAFLLGFRRGTGERSSAVKSEAPALSAGRG